MRELVKQEEVEDSIQHPYGVNELNQFNTKSLQQAVCIAFHRWKSADITDCLKYTSLAHTQHCLRTTDDNGNSEIDFLPNVDLSSTSSHATMYPGVILDITSEFTDLWKTIHKQALSKRGDIVERETDNANVSTPVQASIQSVSIIKALEPVLNNFSLPDPSSSHALPNSLPVNANCKAVADHIHAVLPLNVL